MKISLKIAIAVAVTAGAICVLTENLDSGEGLGVLLVVEGVVWTLYFLFRKNIDAKSETHPDDLYEKLLKVIGCGPATAQRIMEKVQADQELTNREQNFWNEVN